MANNFILLTLDTTPPNIVEINIPQSVYYNDNSPMSIEVSGDDISPQHEVYIEDQNGTIKNLNLTLEGSTFSGLLDVTGLSPGQAFLKARVKDVVLNTSQLYVEGFFITSSGEGSITVGIDEMDSYNNIDIFINSTTIEEYKSNNKIDEFKSTNEISST